MFRFEELDATTRKWMLEEFRAEESKQPYRSTRLSARGRLEFPRLMEEAIETGNEETLATALSRAEYWNTWEYAVRAGKRYSKSINPVKVAPALALTEFNTWYVRGLARRLTEEGEEFCQIYRAAPAWEPRAECVQHDGQVYPVKLIYQGHRACYWPPPGNPQALSIPVGTNCHHTIRRHLPDGMNDGDG